MKSLKLILFVFVATLFVGFLSSCDSKSSNNSESRTKVCEGCHQRKPISEGKIYCNDCEEEMEFKRAAGVL